MPVISEYLDFDFHYLVWFHAEKPHCVTENMSKQVQQIGVAQKIGDDMYYWVLPDLIAGTTVLDVTQEDQLNPEIQVKINKFNITFNN